MMNIKIVCYVTLKMRVASRSVTLPIDLCTLSVQGPGAYLFTHFDALLSQRLGAVVWLIDA
jgi:hypothetical protein